MRNVLQVKEGDWLKRTLKLTRARSNTNGVDLIHIPKVENGIATIHRMDIRPDGSMVCGRVTRRALVDFSRAEFAHTDPPAAEPPQRALPLVPAPPADASASLLRELLDAERERASRAEKRLAVVEAELARLKGAS